MRKSRVIGLVVASLVSAASIAQAQSTATSPRSDRHAAGRGMEGRPGRGGLFRGVNLSEAEKTRLKEIRLKYGAESKSLRESLRPALEEARSARQSGDTAAFRAAVSRTADDREKLRAMMTRARVDIRSALSQENQRVFDANAKQVKQRRSEMRKNWKGDRVGRAGHRGERGPRGHRGHRGGRIG